MNTITIKNHGNAVVIEPYHNVRIEPGESKEFNRNIAQRFLVIRPDVISIVDSVEETVTEPVITTDQEVISSGTTADPGIGQATGQ